MGDKKVMPFQLAFDFTAPRAFSNPIAIVQKAPKGCLNCDQPFKAQSKFRRICNRCKKDPEWRSASKALGTMYSIDLKTNRKSK